MKVLVLGSDGALGHVVFDYLTEYGSNTYGTIRKSHTDNPKIYPNVNLYNIDKLISLVNPSVIINCIGFVKQREDKKDEMIKINSIFPNSLYSKCKKNEIKLVHISSDCVFDGVDGNYTELCQRNAKDSYGYSKGLGEVRGLGAVTLRTSFIGPEKYNHLGLFDWFLSQKSTINGFKNAYFSGITSLELAKVIQKTIEKMESDNISGLYHIGTEKISKYDLLQKIKKRFDSKVEILPDESFVIDRSLDHSKFNKEFNYNCPDWDTMLEELKEWMNK